jgi:hypothetical protein
MTPHEIKEQLREVGYAVIKGFVPDSSIRAMREFWLDYFGHLAPTERVLWAPYLGQSNQVGYTQDKFQCLYRAHDFLWNTPIHRETRDVALKINELRNSVLDEDAAFGTRLMDVNYRVWTSVSYYPGNTGFMGSHWDSTSYENIIHGVLPITFPTEDYQNGGLFLRNRSGVTVYPERSMSSGDVFLYDPTLSHGVSRIVSEGVGRLQMFPLMAPCKSMELNTYALQRVRWSEFLKAKSDLAKDKVRVLLGRQQAIR